jgi:hypothetical protein
MASVLYVEQDELLLSGTCYFTVLVGKVTIFGYEQHQQHLPEKITNAKQIPIYAYPNYGVFHVTIHDEDITVDRKALVRLLESEPSTNTLAKQVPTSFEDVKAIVLVQSMETNFQPNKKRKTTTSTQRSPISSLFTRDLSRYFHIVNIIDGLDMLGELVTSDCIFTFHPIQQVEQVLVCGIKGVGKSVVCRYIVNLLLNEHDHVYLLDLDISTPEQGIPGQMSLLRVSNPIMGPACMNNVHKMDIVQAHVFGSDSLDERVDDYVQLAMSLFGLVDNKYPLVVHTMNTSSFGGYQALVSLLDQMHSLDSVIKIGESKWGEIQHDKLKKYTMRVSEPKIDTKLVQAMYLTYFSSSPPMYKVLWERLRIVLLNVQISPQQVMYYLNGSIVGLGIDADAKLCDKVQISRTRPNKFTFVGFGMIKSICPNQKLYHVMTPVVIDQRINLLIPTGLSYMQENSPFTTAQEIITKNVGANMDEGVTVLRDKQLKHRKNSKKQADDDGF